jgi:hypothetical protein
MVLIARRPVTQLVHLLIAANLTIALAAPADGQVRLVARNRFKTEIVFETEPVPDSGAKVNRVLLRNASGYLAVPATAVQFVPVASARNWTGHWIVQRLADGYVRFLNERTGSTLHFETGSAQVGATQPGWWSAMWSLTGGSVATTPPPPPATHPVMANRLNPGLMFEIESIGLTRIRLRTTAGYLSVVGGRVGITPGVAVPTASSSSEWMVIPVAPATPDCTRPECAFRLASPVATGSLHNQQGPLVVTPVVVEWSGALWSRASTTATPTVDLPRLTDVQPPVAPSRYAMRNRWKPEVSFEIEALSINRVRLRTTVGYLSLVDGRVGITPTLAATSTSSSEWIVASVPPAGLDCTGVNCFFRLLSPVAAGALNNETGSLVVGVIRDDWYSAMWTRAPTSVTPTTPVPPVIATPVASRLAMTNRWKPEVAFEVEPISSTRVRWRTQAGYLSFANGRFGLTSTLLPNTTTTTSEWIVAPISPATPDCVRPDCFFRLTSPLTNGALNNETGPVALTPFALDWYSAMWARGRTTNTPSTSVPVMPAAAPTAPAPVPVAIANRFRAEVKLQAVKPNGPADTAYVHLRTPTGAFLVVDNRQLQFVTAGYGSYLGMWRLEPVAGQQYVRLVNRMTGDYLHTESGQIGIGQVAARTMDMNWWSAMWTVTR